LKASIPFTRSPFLPAKTTLKSLIFKDFTRAELKKRCEHLSASLSKYLWQIVAKNKPLARRTAEPELRFSLRCVSVATM
jgi:hypothetical protein